MDITPRKSISVNGMELTFVVKATVTLSDGEVHHVLAEDFVKLFEAFKDQNIVAIDAKEIRPSEIRQGRKWQMIH